MNNASTVTKPTIGMIVVFKDNADKSLSHTPARVIYIWPRFRSGDYLVTLEYAESIHLAHGWATQLDAFMSELVPVTIPPRATHVAVNHAASILRGSAHTIQLVKSQWHAVHHNSGQQHMVETGTLPVLSQPTRYATLH